MDARARRREFAAKLSAAWGVPVARLRVPPGALAEWVAPHAVEMMGTSALNWAAWLPAAPVAAQSARLLDLRTREPAFLLTKLVPARPPPPERRTAARRLPPGEARDQLADLLAPRARSLALRDEVAGEARRPLFRSAADARAKLAAARDVYVLGDVYAPQAVALVGDEAALGLALAAPARGLARLREAGAPLALVDVVLASNCPADRAATRLLAHVEYDLPGHLLAAPCPPALGALRLHAACGYAYGAPDLLPRVVSRLEGAVRAWHGGFPALTHAAAGVEEAGPRLTHAPADARALAARATHAAHVFLADAEDAAAAVARAAAGEAQLWIWAGGLRVSEAVGAALELLASGAVEAVDVIGDGAAHAEARAVPLPPRECVLDAPVDEATSPRPASPRPARPRPASPRPASPRPASPGALDSDLDADWVGELDADMSADRSPAPDVARDYAVNYSPALYEPFEPRTSAYGTYEPFDPGAAEQPPADALEEGAAEQPPADAPEEAGEAWVHTAFYTPREQLRTREALQAALLALRRRGYTARDVTAELRPLVGEFVGREVRPGERGVVLARGKQLTHACVYAVAGDRVRIAASACPEGGAPTRLFALLLKLKWGKKRVGSEHGGCVALAEAVAIEDAATLFEAAVDAAEQEAFARECLVATGGRAVSLCRA